MDEDRKETEDTTSFHQEAFLLLPLHPEALPPLQLFDTTIQARADVDQPDNDDFTPLHMAAQEGKLDIIRYLIERRADVNQADRWGQTPLFLAAESGNLEIVRYLIEEKGADVNQADRWGQTPLLLAACYGHTEVVQELIEKRANIDQADNEGDTPLSLAIHYGCVDAVGILLANGALIPENISFGEDVNQETRGIINHILEAYRAYYNLPNRVLKTFIGEIIEAIRSNGNMEWLLEQNTLMINNYSELKESPLSYFAGRVLEYKAIRRLAEERIDPNASSYLCSFFNVRDKSMMACAAVSQQPASVSSEEVTIKTSAESASASCLIL